ncbi:transposase [Streptomyces sp. NPDC048045]|uniref:transposase n=1 Tax=Streptomyces sp. NPDC048045 TaxID=3154710 RepID=UPI003415A237
MPAASNSRVSLCDCLAHRFGNAADPPDRIPCHGSDMTEAEWQVIRVLLPEPAGLEERSGRPEGYCQRVMLDAVRYVVDNGVKWANLTADFAPYPARACFRPPLADDGPARRAPRPAAWQGPGEGVPTRLLLEPSAVPGDAKRWGLDTERQPPRHSRPYSGPTRRRRREVRPRRPDFWFSGWDVTLRPQRLQSVDDEQDLG